MNENHTLIGGNLHVYRRERSSYWQCSTFLKGRNHRKSTGETSLEHAKAFAEEWYLSLKVRDRAGELKQGVTFHTAAERFEREYAALTAGERNARYVENIGQRLRKHLIPFFGNMVVSDITPGLVQEYRVHRATSRKHPKTGESMRPARSTLHQEIVALRHVLKTAERHGWLKFVPDLSAPYKASGKISHRAWFSLEEYTRLYEATRERAKNPPKKRWRWACEQLHDFVLFMVNTGLRPDEALRLEFRDVEIVEDEATGETILEISVRGKRGVGYCKSMPGAVTPFQRLQDRKRPIIPPADGRHDRQWTSSDGDDQQIPEEDLALPQQTDRIFPRTHRELFNVILGDLNLKRDREGLPRTAYSLRHTYICLRLMEGADIYQIAKNCRTSVEMIEKYYASHIKNMIDAASVNVRRNRPNGRFLRGAANAKRPKPRGKRRHSKFGG